MTITPDNGNTQIDADGEDSPEVRAALSEAQAIANRINIRLDNIHNDLQASILSVREAHETVAAIRRILATESGQ